LTLNVTYKVPERCAKIFILSNVTMELNLSGTETKFRAEKINFDNRPYPVD